MSFKCSKCNGETTVRDSRPTHVGKHIAIRRRRECVSCGRRFSTFETEESGLRGDYAKVVAAESAIFAVEEAVKRARKVIGEPVDVFDSNM